MDHENQHQTPELPPTEATAETSFKAVLEAAPTSEALAPTRESKLVRAMRWIFTGGQGLRAGWSVAIAPVPLEPAAA